MHILREARSMTWLSLFVGLVAGCSLFRSAINDSPGIRWFLFSNFGASHICPEMQKRGAALKLTSDEISGRFFPSQCQSQVDDATQTVSVHFAGTGYAWTPVAGRIGFSCVVKVEYRPDFTMTEDALYVFGRMNRIVEGPTFTVLSIENPMVDWAAQGPAGYLAQTFGQQLVSSKLAEGFTVVRTDEGDDFTLGILYPPARPRHPFNTSEGNFVVANEATQVRAGQADFVGPFQVADVDQVLLLRWRSAGVQSEGFIYPRAFADPMRLTYEQGGGLIAPTVVPSAQLAFPLGETSTRMKLPPGEYVMVIDNSDRLGQIAPPWNPLAVVGSGAASLAYIIELADE
jgi:hypothetical protein